MANGYSNASLAALLERGVVPLLEHLLQGLFSLERTN